MSVQIKVMRYEIVCPIDTTWDEFGKVLRDVQYAVWKTYNRAVQMAWDYQQFSFSYRKRFGAALKFSDLGTGKNSQLRDTYAEMTAQFPEVGTRVIESAIHDALHRFNALSSDIANGTKSIPSFKRDIPIPVSAQSIRLRKDGANRIIRFSLLSRESGKQTAFDVKVRAKGSSSAIFDRLINGEYTLGESKILRIKSKWYVNLTYKFEAKESTIDRTNVLGVDMGVVNAAALALHDGHARMFIEGNEIAAFRKRIEQRRVQMLHQSKYCGEGRKGHGRATLLRPTDKLADKIANFRATTNHKYAKAIVEFALKHGCGTIQVEDLSGVTEHDAFLKSWTYFDLQTKIEQKAAEHGITFRKINPRYTSQRCSCCGYIAEGNRKSQAKFECVICGFKANADYNAAKNIANPRIEALIDEELLRQAHEKRQLA